MVFESLSLYNNFDNDNNSFLERLYAGYTQRSRILVLSSYQVIFLLLFVHLKLSAHRIIS